MAADGVNAVASPGWRYYLQEKVLVIFFLGFSAGLPFLLVYSTLSAWLKDAGLQMSTISTFAWLPDAFAGTAAQLAVACAGGDRSGVAGFGNDGSCPRDRRIRHRRAYRRILFGNAGHCD
jgi:hypothetical protein